MQLLSCKEGLVKHILYLCLAFTALKGLCFLIPLFAGSKLPFTAKEVFTADAVPQPTLGYNTLRTQ